MKRAILRLALGLGAAAALVLPAVADEYDCIIEARQMVDIRSPVEGLIERVAVERGEGVKKGQVLVTLESGPERAALAVAKQRAGAVGAVKSAEARLDLAVKKERRAEELARQSFISSNALEEARTERSLAESDLKVARENQRLAELEVQRASEVLGMRTIRSPVNGVVVDRYSKTGEMATTTAKDPILRVAEIDPLNVEVVLPVALFGSVVVGDVAEVNPAAPVGGSHQAKVVIVDSVIDAASGTFGVRLELPNPNGRVPAGLQCRVRFAPAPTRADR
jgi:RND family efflux transporter MFP subunit